MESCWIWIAGVPILGWARALDWPTFFEYIEALKTNMSNSPQPLSSGPGLGLLKAITIGWLVVNIPAIAIMLISLLVGFAVDPRIWWLFFSVGFVLGWTWWSHSVPRWRRWAVRRGVDPDRLQKWAVLTGLVWPKGSLFEKTEARPRD